MRLALLLSAVVLLVRAQGEEDRKFHHRLYWIFSTLTPPPTPPLQPTLPPHTFWGDFLYLVGRQLRSHRGKRLQALKVISLLSSDRLLSLSLFLPHLLLVCLLPPPPHPRSTSSMHAERVAVSFSMLSSRPGLPLADKKNVHIYSCHL